MSGFFIMAVKKLSSEEPKSEVLPTASEPASPFTPNVHQPQKPPKGDTKLLGKDITRSDCTTTPGTDQVVVPMK